MAARKRRRTRDPLRGRFKGGVHPALAIVNRSLPRDSEMWKEDVEGSVAHARMLGACGILPRGVVSRIVSGLRKVAGEFEKGTFRALPSDEDVHMAVERRLTELIGDDGKRLHTARSRNDQVATDLLLHLAGRAEHLRLAVRDLQVSLVALADRDGDAILPFYTHLQRAQPVLLGHVLLAYVEMLEQDRRALEFPLADCPLGSGAGAGVGFPIDRRLTANALGFRRPSPNSLASVSTRQEATHFASAMASTAVTLSRFGADLVNWTSREFGFARLGDAVSTGSSIMPQKRNPDGAELLRAMAVRVTQAPAALLELQRGLPLGYFKDLQEDKEHLFGAWSSLYDMLGVARAMAEDVQFDTERMRAAVDDPAGFILATEAADWLAWKGVSFREAHEAVGRLVSEAERRGVGIGELPIEEFVRAHPAFDASVLEALTAEAAVRARRAVGGTAPGNVRREIRRWHRAFEGERSRRTRR